MSVIFIVMAIAVFILSIIFFVKFNTFLDGIKINKIIENFLNIIIAFCLSIIIMGFGIILIVI